MIQNKARCDTRMATFAVCKLRFAVSITCECASTTTDMHPAFYFTAKLPRNFQKCNFQATGPWGYPSIPEADTIVERPILVQNGQFLPSSCLKRHFVCILLHLLARAKAKNAPPT